jgi:hypothetical protein
MCIPTLEIPVTPAEISLAKLLKDDLGVEINPQALRMFIRARWDRVSLLAHVIHSRGGDSHG